MTADPMTASPGSERARLDRSLVQGLAWTSGIKWVVQGVTWAFTILVMRLLSPEDYGLVGMATVFIGLVTLMSEFGLGSAVVALRSLTERQIAQLHSVAVIGGLVAALVSLGAARPLAAFFNAPALFDVVLVLSTTFLISSLMVVPTGVLRRDLRYRTLALVEAGQSVGDVITTLVLAWLGFGYWSLVLGQVCKFLIGSAAILWIRPQSFARPRLDDLRGTLGFSAHVITGRAAWYGYSTADYLVVGRLLGQGALGLYNLAFTLSRMPAQKITGMVTRVSPGIFSAVQHDAAELRRYILSLTEALSIITFPPIFGLGLVAPELIPFVLGDEWTGAILPLQVLSVGAALGGISPLLPQVLNVVGETAFVMRRSVITAFVLVPGFVVGGVFWGVTGVAASWVILEPLVVTGPILRKIRDRTGLTIREYGAALWPAVSGCLPMAAVVVALRMTLGGTLDPAVLLAIEVTAGALTYAGVVLALHRSRLERIRRAVTLLRK